MRFHPACYRILITALLFSMITTSLLPPGISMARAETAASSEALPPWAEREIASLREAGIIQGYSDGSFKPGKLVTRAEYAVFLNRLSPEETAGLNGTTLTFSDVTDEWFAAEVRQAVRRGISQGYPDGTFRPNEAVNRLEAAVMLDRVLHIEQQGSVSFTDSSRIPSWAAPAVSALTHANLLQGYPDGTFGGERKLTRAETAVLLYRAQVKLSGTGTPPEEEPAKPEGDGTESPVPQTGGSVGSGGSGSSGGNPGGSPIGNPGGNPGGSPGGNPGGNPGETPGNPDGGTNPPPVEDRTPPAIPAGLTALAGNGTVKLEWQAVNDSDLAGYKAYVSVDEGATWKEALDAKTETAHTFSSLTNGTAYHFAVTAYDRSGNESAKSASVAATPAAPADPNVPSDPAVVAPALQVTGKTRFADSTSFLYTGDQPIQKGVQPGTIREERVTVLRGTVLDASGQPLEGVAVSILDHPEYGHTHTRTDGMFDLAVNGGSTLVVEYSKDGYMPIQRKITVPVNDFASLPDVVLLAYDSRVTEVRLNDTDHVQVAQGSPVTDEDGTRQATMIFPKNTTAELIMPDGTKQPLESLHVRATEYTVGEDGPSSMPGDLPAHVGYTYAVELSADEAVEAGAAEIRFNQPLHLYVDNFLEFPVGEVVPIGYYDRQLGAWVPSDNGKVIQVLNTDGRVAAIDSDGDGQPDDEAKLAEIGMTLDERRQLAALYKPGHTLWRSPIEHFTPWDCNWPYGPPEDAVPPPDEAPNEDKPDEEDPCQTSGSVIGCQDQSLQEIIPVTGTGMSLVYSSKRTEGYKSNVLDIQLMGDTAPSSLKEIRMELQVAGQRIVKTFTPSPNLTYTYEWNGKDAYGREMFGQTSYHVKVLYEYPLAYYASSSDFTRSFGRLSGQNGRVIGNRASATVSVDREWKGQLRSTLNPFEESGVAGWSLNNHHASDGSRVYLGSGGQLSLGGQYRSEVVQPLDEIIQSKHDQMAITPDGTIHMILEEKTPEGARNRLVSRDESGNLIESELPAQGILHLRASQAGELYVSGFDWSAQDEPTTIWRKVKGTEEWVKVAGGGSTAARNIKQGQALTEISLGRLYNFEVDREGRLYLLMDDRLFRADLDGVVEVMSSLAAEVQAPEGPATPGRIGFIDDFQLGTDGSIYLYDQDGDSSYRDRFRKITPDGMVRLIFHSEPYGAQTTRIHDGAHVSEEIMSNITSGFKVDYQGNLYMISSLYPNYDMFKLTTEGYFQLIKEDYLNFHIHAHITTVSPDGDIYYVNVDQDNPDHSYSRFTQKTSVTSGNLAVDEEGRYAFEFETGTGRHLKTLDAVTGHIIYTYQYDDAGCLLSITDRYGDAVTIERDASGVPIAIAAPSGQRTELTVNGQGELIQVVNPAGEDYEIQYSANGLVTQFVDPNGNVRKYGYDEAGLLLTAEDPEGGVKTLSRHSIKDGYQVTLTSPAGRTTTFSIQNMYGTIRRETIDSNGASTVSTAYPDGRQEIAYPDGTKVTKRLKPDPRWGMSVPVLAELRVSSPSGKPFVYQEERLAVLENTADPFSLKEYTVLNKVNGVSSSVHYDAAQRMYTETSLAGRQVRTHMNEKFEVVRVENNQGYAPTTYEYDDQGRLSTMQKGTQFVRYTYDSLNRMVEAEDASGSRKHFEYDKANRLVSVRQPGGNTYSKQYDANSNLTGIVMPDQALYEMGYTGLDKLESFMPGGNPDMAVQREFAPGGELSKVTMPSGRQLEYQYDEGGRMTGMNDPDVQRAFEYAGRTNRISGMKSTSNGRVQSVEYQYDDSEVVSMNWSGEANAQFEYSYDWFSNLSNIRMTVPTAVYGTVTNAVYNIPLSWDVDGVLLGFGPLYYGGTDDRHSWSQISGLCQNDDDWNPCYGEYFHTSITQDELGRMEELRYSKEAGCVYPEGGALTTMHSLPNDGDYCGEVIPNLYSVKYQYDLRGWMTGKTVVTPDGTETYTYEYDANGQLLHATRVSPAGETFTESYTYDQNRNRTSRQVSGSPEETAIYGPYDQLMQVGPDAYHFNEDGYLTERGTDRFHYGVHGELLEAAVNGETIQYTYDATGRRTSRIDSQGTTTYLYGNPHAALQLTASVDPQGALTVYYYNQEGFLTAFDRGGSRYLVITDAVGTPLAVINADGDTVKELRYDSFGVLLSDSNPAFGLALGFAGGLADEATKLVRFGSRDYDPASGRWTARDPILYDSNQANLYVYVNNNPVQLRDPCGMFCVGGSAYAGAGGGAQACFTDEGMSVCGELGFGAGGGLEVSPSGDLAPNSASVEASVKGGVGPVSGKIGGKMERNFDTDCVSGGGIAEIGIGPVTIDFTDPGNTNIGGDWNDLNKSLPDVVKDSMADLSLKAEASAKGKVCGQYRW
ncbi:hypothetical protein DNH61_12470 [Paenibacillus sambharensis]|uniref:Uncharacterized protein n=1 Tax=Paenibacillus sambharensis TaxID=1803190 RepID=A0A2W1LB49_9BACL|nr:S-layer homology domain-containing protein [Paenibacillus sambharensis]PZD95350.1 hypothetical protein DNH61_12470 [Paenibacillus sambharensis]